MVAITTTSNSGEVKESLGIGLGVDDRNRWLQFLVSDAPFCPMTTPSLPVSSSRIMIRPQRDFADQNHLRHTLIESHQGFPF